MDLKIFFDVIDTEPGKWANDPYSFGNHIMRHSSGFPDWKSADIALIGLTEDRGTLTNKGAEKGAEPIRQAIYSLKKGTGNYRIVDLGNLRCGIGLEDSYLRIKEVCEVLLSHKVLPILFGGTHDLDYGQYISYEKFDKLINVLSIDALLDMQGSDEWGMENHHTHRLMVHDPNFLFHFTNLGYQAYLNDNATTEVLEKLGFERFRVGQIRENITEMEPVIRNADMLSFDISSIKSTDAPGNANAIPFGLTGEEACQLCWYAGYNEKLSSAGFYGYNPEFDVRSTTSKVIGTMIWYLVEGFYNRKHDLDFMSQDFTKFIVNLPQEPNIITFYKSLKTEKWWMEVPFPIGKNKYSRVSIVPCSYSDYETACAGELPVRWVNTIGKLI